MRLALLIAAILATTAPETRAQTIDQIRDALRQLVESERYAAFVAALVDLTDDTEMSAARITVDGDPELELSTFKFPYRTTFDIRDWTPDLYVEANFGYLSGRIQIPDLYSGSNAQLATRVDSKWEAVSGLAGVGLQFPITDDLAITPIANVSVSHVSNDTVYSGPGAAITQAIADGILFNYEATLVTYGGALRATYDHDLSRDVTIQSVARYDFRHTEGISTTDEAQDPSVDTHKVTARVDFTGPAGVRIFGEDLSWRTISAYTRFLGDTGEQLGFDDYFELGFGLESGTDGALGPLSQITVSGSVLLANDLFGWTVGLGVSF